MSLAVPQEVRLDGPRLPWNLLPCALFVLSQLGAGPGGASLPRSSLARGRSLCGALGSLCMCARVGKTGVCTVSAVCVSVVAVCGGEKCVWSATDV